MNTDQIPGTEPFDSAHRYIVVLAPRPDRVRHARRMVTTMLRHWQLEHLRDNAELVASELVTNAIQHARDQHPITVTVAHDERWLSIAVKDRSAGLPRTAQASAWHENGRGLLLVEYLAESWFCESHSDGTKTVSCRLPIA
jgi:anti-sigma regulatory factor (Ser/Thr protein kinase)